MALEPGGYADKLGNRYEDRWVARQLLGILNEDILAVTVEPVGEDGEGVDLWVELADGTRQAQQCKLRNRSSDSWSVADLNSSGILAKARKQLDRDPSVEFALVTAVSSMSIHDLCVSARLSNGSSRDFVKYQIQAIGETRQKPFRQFCTYLGLNHEEPVDQALAYTYLHRFFIKQWSDATSGEEILFFAKTLVQGDPEIVIAVLTDYAKDRLRQKLTAEMLWVHLKSKNLHPRKLEHDDRVLPRVHKLQEKFKKSIHLIQGELISRAETQNAIDALDDTCVVVIHGRPGQGKSGVLYGLADHFDKSGWPYLPIRLLNSPSQNPIIS